MLRPKGQSCLYKSSQTFAVSPKPQTECSLYETSDYIWVPVSSCHITPVSISLNAGIKGMWSQVLRPHLCELCFSFRQIQSRVSQCGHELTEVCLPPPPKICATCVWTLQLPSVLVLHSVLQAQRCVTFVGANKINMETGSWVSN